jgi:tRNA (mo5U34)-methyltransferase
MPDHLSRDPIERRIAELGEWFQNLDLRGHSTAPDHFLGDYPAKKWRAFADALPSDLRGLTVLDAGCNAGFYAIEMKRRGAERVVGIDWDERYLAQARFAADVCEVDIEFHELSIYDVGALGEQFDVVLFMGVLYHLRHPLLALDLLHEHVTRDVLVFQSMLRGSSIIEPVDADYPFHETAVFDATGYPRLHFVERAFSGDATNWWIPNQAAAEGMLRSAGYELIAHPETEVFICRHVDVRDEGPRAVYPVARPGKTLRQRDD